MKLVERINPSQLAGIVHRDVQDTLEKMYNVMPIMLDILTADEGDEIEVTTDEVNSLISGSLVLDDGDYINFRKSDDESSLIVVYYTSGERKEQEIASIQNDTLVMSNIDGIYAVSGDLWTLDEVSESIANTVSTNEVVSRATDLISQSKYSKESFVAACSDILATLSDEGKLMYSLILDSVSAENPLSVLSAIQSCYANITNAIAQDNTIDFSPNDFYVKGFLGTFVNVVTDLALPILNVIAFAINPILGAAVTAISFIWTGIRNYISNKGSAEATVNYDATNKLFAQPLFQVKLYADQNIPQSAYDKIKALIDIYQLVQIEFPFFTTFWWFNDGQLCVEAFADMRTPGLYDHISDEYNQYLRDYFFLGSDSYGDYIRNDYKLVASEYDTFSSHVLNSLNPMNYTGYSDSEILYRIYSSISLITLIMVSTSRNNTAGSIWYDTLINMQEGGSLEQMQTNAVLLSDRSFPASAVARDWSDIVNKAIPCIYNYMSNSNNCYDFMSFILVPIINATEEQILGNFVTDGAIIIYETQERGDFMVVPPNYTPGALLWSVVAVAAVAAITVITYKVSKTLIKRKITTHNAKAYLQVKRKYDTWASDPTPDNYKSYMKSARKYNRYSAILGRSAVSLVNPSQNQINYAASSADSSFFTQAFSKDIQDAVSPTIESISTRLGVYTPQ